MRGLYSIAVCLALPLILAWFAYRGLRDRRYRHGWRERLGFYREPVPEPGVWLHAASVGEVQAALPLIRALRSRYPDLPLLITTMTPTGRARAAETLGEAVTQRYLPLDTPGAVRRFLDHCRPRLAVIMEMELWPNLIRAADCRGVPLLLTNARLSARSAAGYQRFAGLIAPTLAAFDRIAAQSEADAGRFRDLGVDDRRLLVAGNIKFEWEAPASAVAAGVRLRSRLGAGRPVWIAASTHEGEDELLLSAHRRVRERYPQAVLMLVPRHPERFDAVASLCRQQGFGVAWRTAGDAADFGAEVFLGDTIGELPALLAAADLAFVGGSLTRIGGHNPLEPAALDLPVLTGPHRFNFSEAYDLLEAAGGARQVADADELTAAVIELLGNPAQRQSMGHAAAGVVAANRGALDRLLGAVEALMAADDEPRMGASAPSLRAKRSNP